MRRNKMNHLFVRLGEKGMTDRAVRHAWATKKLGREVGTFTSLTVDEIDVLIASLLEFSDADDTDEYVMCGAPCPDGEPCVVDVGHIDRGEDHAREDGIAWAVR